MDVVVSNLCWLPKAQLSEADVFLMKKRLTIFPPENAWGKKDEDEEEPPKVINMWRETTSHIGVPRAYFMAHKTSRHNIVLRLPSPTPAMSVFDSNIKLRSDDQEPVVQKMLEQFRAQPFFGGILQAYTGYGKCLKFGTKVVMADGSMKEVQDIRVGDQLMGPDSKPRNVLSLGQGRSEMYRVTPKKGGQPFECNGDHILYLKVTGKRWNKGKSYGSGSIAEISVDDYRNPFKTRSGMRHLLKLVRSSGIDFPVSDVPFDPYMIGMWLGDGTSEEAYVTTADRELDDYFNRFAAESGLLARRVTPNDRCPGWIFTTGVKGRPNYFRRYLRNICRDDDGKVVPDIYLKNSRDVRLALLAGLVDSDGHYQGMNNYEIVSTSQRFAQQVAFLVRSLGLGCKITKKRAEIKSTGFKGWCWRVTFYGSTGLIPCKLARKINSRGPSKCDPLLSGFTVESIGEGNYYGFTLDGDHLFLLEDFTISHNTTTALEFAKRLGFRTLILVHKNPLKDQWVERIQQFMPAARVGVVQSDKCQFEGRDFVIGMIQSMMQESGDKYPRELWGAFGLVICDEVHRCGAAAFSTVAPKFNTPYYLGLSATPKRKDGCDNAFKWVIGQVIAAPTDKNRAKPIIYLRNTGIRAQYEYRSKKTGEMVYVDLNDFKKPTLLKRIAKNKFRNAIIIEDILKALKAGRSPLIMAERLDILHCIAEGAMELAPTYLGRTISAGMYIGGKKREELDLAASCDIVLATVQLAKEGIDIEKLDTLFMATPVGDPVQIIGRIGRAKTVKMPDGSAQVVPPKNRPMVVDYIDYDLSALKGSFFSRLKYYKKLGFDTMGMKV